MTAKLEYLLFLSILCASPALATPITGGTTSVTLDSGFVSLVTGAGITPAAVAPGTLVGATATFPITGGDTSTGLIAHSGGLSFAKGAQSAIIENFLINLNSMSLSGDVIANGGTPTMGIALFNIGAGNELTINSALAGGLSAVFGVPNLTGANVGIATVSPVTAAAVPEPAALGLLFLGMVLGAAAVRRATRAQTRPTAL